MFSLLFVWLFVMSVLEQETSKIYGQIWMKLGGKVGCVTRPNCFDFGEDPAR